jgi:hypothetical protein
LLSLKTGRNLRGDGGNIFRGKSRYWQRRRDYKSIGRWPLKSKMRTRKGKTRVRIDINLAIPREG